jgi:hypothetical protein
MIVLGGGGAIRRAYASKAVQQQQQQQVLFPDARVHARGDLPYGSREYILLPPNVSLQDTLMHGEDTNIIASIRAHRNIIFGARVLTQHKSPLWTIDAVCPPLFKVALEDASAQGEQVQAVSTLHGLCDWVARNLGSETELPCPSRVLEDLQNDPDATALEAVRAIATGIPRPGHSVIGQGTFRDARVAWERLAKEFIQYRLSEEAKLYQLAGAELVNIEHLADTQPAYLMAAGGAMARFFFM